MFKKKKPLLEEISAIYEECGLESLGIERKVDMGRLRLCDGWFQQKLVWDNEVLLSIDWNFEKQVQNGRDYRPNKGVCKLKIISNSSTNEVQSVTFNSTEELRGILKKWCEEIRLKKVFAASGLIYSNRLVQTIADAFEKDTISKEKLIKELKRVFKVESSGQLELAVNEWKVEKNGSHLKNIELRHEYREETKKIPIKKILLGKGETNIF